MREPTFPDLRAFLDQLRSDRDLVEVSAPVDPHLEVAEIHRRVIAAGGPALLFTDVRGPAAEGLSVNEETGGRSAVPRFTAISRARPR